MKKIIYTLLIAMFSTFALSACTEEEVAPSTENGGGNAEVSIPK